MKKITECLIRPLVLFEKSKKLHSAFEKQIIYLENNSSGIKNKVFLNLAITKTDYGKRMSAAASVLQTEFRSSEFGLHSDLMQGWISVYAPSTGVGNHTVYQCQCQTTISQSEPALFDHFINFFQNKTQSEKFWMSVERIFTPETRGVCVNMSTKNWKLWLKTWTEKFTIL